MSLVSFWLFGRKHECTQHCIWLHKNSIINFPQNFIFKCFKYFLWPVKRQKKLFRDCHKMGKNNSCILYRSTINLDNCQRLFVRMLFATGINKENCPKLLPISFYERQQNYNLFFVCLHVENQQNIAEIFVTCSNTGSKQNILLHVDFMKFIHKSMSCFFNFQLNGKHIIS